MPDVTAEASMLEWAGVYFGEEEVFQLKKSMKKLALMSGATQLRFWGKIYGTQKDYWIVEGELNKSEEKPSDDTQELRGSGCNKYVYWVTESFLQDWI